MAKEKSKSKHQQKPGAPDVPEQLSRRLGEEATMAAQRSEDNTDSTPPASKPKQSASEDTTTKEIIDSRRTDEAVEDIVRKEGDELLDNHDEAVGEHQIPKPKKSWWKRKGFIWTVVLVLLAAAGTLMAVPKMRYLILNTLGVRVNASVVVVDKTTGQPLKNVSVRLGASTTETDDKGHAALSGLKLGPQTLVIERIAFAKIEQQATLGWGSNPLGTFELTPSGSQYTFIVRDYVSGQPIEGVEVSSGRAAAVADKEGKAVLTLGKTTDKQVQVTISANGYRNSDKVLAINTTADVNVTLVPSSKAVFVGSSDGRYNLYGMYIDGKDRKILLEGSGTETSDMQLAVSTDGSQAALVSTRESIKAEDGSLLDTITLVGTNGDGSKTVDRGADVQLIDWIGTTLVYRLTVPGAAANSSDRQKLMSYDYSSDKRTVLAAANEFASVASAQGAIYFADGTNKFTKVNPDGSSKQTAVNTTVQHAYRTEYNTLMLQTTDGWQQFDLGSEVAAPANAPSSTTNQIYVTNLDGQSSLWVNGGTLMVHSLADGTDKQLQTQTSYPVRWLNNTVAEYRTGSAIYVVSTQGGESRKVADVIGTQGLTQTY